MVVRLGGEIYFYDTFLDVKGHFTLGAQFIDLTVEYPGLLCVSNNLCNNENVFRNLGEVLCIKKYLKQHMHLVNDIYIFHLCI